MNKQQRVAIIGTMGLPARYGGFETLAHYLVLHLGKDFDFTVYCSGPDYPERVSTYLDARLKYLPFRANGVQSIVFDLCNLLHACFRADVLLVLGVSGGIFLPIVGLFRKKVILNVGGLDWQRSKWGPAARWFLKVSERIAIRWADVLIADNAGISDYFHNEYNRESLLIEYGGDQVSTTVARNEMVIRYPFLESSYAFSVARIQADNNIEMILEAFANVPEWPLVFVGDWKRNDYGRRLKDRFQEHTNLHLLEAIYDQTELNGLRGHCSIYVHGHSAGGTNPSLVEAMHLSLPIAAYDVVYNRATTEGEARYFKSDQGLVDLLRSVMTMEWEAQRPIMKAIAERRYRWDIIVRKYSVAFREAVALNQLGQSGITPA